MNATQNQISEFFFGLSLQAYVIAHITWAPMICLGILTMSYRQN